jgi:hypothetical protein
LKEAEVGVSTFGSSTRLLFLTQRFARHANPVTTVVYTHPTDEELYSQISAI